jgi:hypothetical protein
MSPPLLGNGQQLFYAGAFTDILLQKHASQLGEAIEIVRGGIRDNSGNRDISAIGVALQQKRARYTSPLCEINRTGENIGG